MITRDEPVLVAVSGGKDSLALWDVLIEEGYRTAGLYLDLGIFDYSQESKARCEGFAAARGEKLYVERVADPNDARAFVIRRTRKGWAYNQAAAEEVAKIQEEWTLLLGPAKMKALKSLLAELVAKLGHHYEGSYLDAVRRLPGKRSGSRVGPEV